MKKILFVLLILNLNLLQAQSQETYSVFFEVGKHEVSTQNKQELINFVKNVDPKILESVAILGYCDDRGSESFNLKLSNERANKIQNILENEGFEHIITVEIKGKGKISIDEDNLTTDIEKIRSANRRVDLIFTYKSNFPKIPGVYFVINEHTKMGDRIYLNSIEFPIDRSVLTRTALQELDKIVVQLKTYKNLHIEIQGHICCTGGSPEAVDKDTRKEELSVNRAKAVYYYLLKKRIDPGRLTYKGYGNKKPLGLDQNLDKRVEFLITKS
jgi:outer membrane protein OmpA-like peptidoglycan-associated protein